MSRCTVRLSTTQWHALRNLGQLGILCADILGPDDHRFRRSEELTQTAHDALLLVDDALKAQILGTRSRRRKCSNQHVVEAEHFDLAQAFKEGWTMDLDELADEWTVRDVDNEHKGHRAALAFVSAAALNGSAYHVAALDWLQKQNALHVAAASVSAVASLDAAR